MIQSITTRRSRQADPRVQSGKPERQARHPARSDRPEQLGPGVRSWFRECGSDAHDLANHVPSPELPEPDAPDGRRDGAALWAEMMIEASLPPVETDAAFLARLASEEAAERDRIETTYLPDAPGPGGYSVE